MNLQSKILNSSEIARLLGLSKQTYLAKLKGKKGYMPFTELELKINELLIKRELNLKS